MTETVTLSERELLQKFRELSEEKQAEALDFISFLKLGVVAQPDAKNFPPPS